MLSFICGQKVCGSKNSNQVVLRLCQAPKFCTLEVLILQNLEGYSSPKKQTLLALFELLDIGNS